MCVPKDLDTKSTLKEEALDFHKNPQPGKISISPTKPLFTSYDLSLAYSPGVAFPCEEIYKNKDDAYLYTSKGNMVAVISNGTAVLGLGNLGSLASKPVMEGKSVLFKRFADIDSVDVQIDSTNTEEIIRAISLIGETWGGINLEDFKSPECFEIELELRKKLNIPVFHDDQHGTAIITLAGLTNAAEITNKEFSSLKVVINGSGAAGIACLELIRNAGVRAENITLCDSKGPIYIGRKDGMNKLKEKYAIKTNAKTLTDALKGADVFLGLSVKDVLTPEMLKDMAKQPIIFAMANPDPEIKPELARQVRPDAIIATGRSDYPNQVNNVMGFPYIFRGALDVMASEINEEMKIAAAHAIANIAKQPIPYDVLKAYPTTDLEYGPNYIIPTPFDPRLISEVSSAVAQAAIDSGVAKKAIENMEQYKNSLLARAKSTLNIMEIIFQTLCAQTSKRIIFAEGEELDIIRVAVIMARNNYAKPILIGKKEKIEDICKKHKINIEKLDITINNAALSPEKNEVYIQSLFKKLNREGYLERDCERMVKSDRNIFASAMLEHGEGDSLITGYTRGANTTLKNVRKTINYKSNVVPYGFCVLVSPKRTVLIADTLFHERPTAQMLASIAKSIAEKSKIFGIIPRVAFTSYSNFGSDADEEVRTVQQAVAILDQDKEVDFEYDGEMTVKIAISENPKKNYPFNRLSGSANILISPNLSASNFATSLVADLDADAKVIGPIVTGFERPVQILNLGCDLESILTISAISLMD